MGLKVNRRSINAYARNLDTLHLNVARMNARTLIDHAEDVMSLSMEMIPVDTHSAQMSNFTGRVETTDTGIRLKFGYSDVTSTKINPKTGKPTSYYVYDIHEGVGAPFQFGSPKFLEMPVDMTTDRFKSRWINYLAEALAESQR